MEGLNELALFAGAGGGILGGKLLGWRTVCAVEIDTYCRRVLCDRQDDGTFEAFPIWDDIKTFNGRPWKGRIDVISGGFPCQPYSSAARGHHTAKCLWNEMRRIIEEIRPRFVFAENVTKTAIERAGRQLCEMGYQCKATQLSAADVGADHIRERFWLLGNANNKEQSMQLFNDEMARVPQLQTTIWASGASLPGMVDGVAHRLLRIKAIGNGQVPAVVAAAWRILSVDL